MLHHVRSLAALMVPKRGPQMGRRSHNVAQVDNKRRTRTPFKQLLMYGNCAQTVAMQAYKQTCIICKSKKHGTI
jgi:hypothetical protein